MKKVCNNNRTPVNELTYSIIEIPKGDKWGKKAYILCTEIVAEKLPNLGKDNIQVQKI
jgi:hypothetical protein